MNERVVEILVYIMTEIRGKRSQPDKLELISRALLRRGYTQHEISFAFSWLFERYQGESEELVRNHGGTLPGSFRVLHEAERRVIAPEAYGYLLQLKLLHLVNDLDIEWIIERAMMLGAARVTEADIKALVATMLFSPEGMGDKALLFYEDNPVIH